MATRTILLADGRKLEVDNDWSFKNFTNRTASFHIPKGTIVYASMFLQEKPDEAEVFDPDMVDVVFVHCDLSNVVIPPGNTLVNCSTVRFEVQGDKLDWLIDEDKKPDKPIDWKERLEKGEQLPDPKQLPPKEAALDPNEPAEPLKEI